VSPNLPKQAREHRSCPVAPMGAALDWSRKPTTQDDHRNHGGFTAFKRM